MIAVEKLGFHAGKFSLQAISFHIRPRQYAALMGRTGSGKTTLIECICGLRRVERGSIRLGGKDVTAWPPARRGVGYVPQDGALFPTMTVREHLGFPLLIRRWPRWEISRRIASLVELLEIGHLLDRKPAGLSGGEAQRVALGRALAFRPSVLVLDEPMSALDDDTRQQMYILLRRVRQETEVTALHVTHNRQEAQALADVLFRLQDGRVTGGDVDGSAADTALPPAAGRSGPMPQGRPEVD